MCVCIYERVVLSAISHLEPAFDTGEFLNAQDNPHTNTHYMTFPLPFADGALEIDFFSPFCSSLPFVSCLISAHIFITWVNVECGSIRNNLYGSQSYLPLENLNPCM